MSEYDRIVSVTVTKTGAPPTQAGFGTPLIASYHTSGVARVKTFNTAAEMLDDGFVATDAAYIKAVAIKSQNPAPPQFKIGRLALAPTYTYQLIPSNVEEGFEYEFTIVSKAASTDISYTVPAAASIASNVTAIQALIDAITDVTATDDTTHITVTADDAGYPLRISGYGNNIEVTETTADPGFATDIAAIANEDDDWYGLCVTSGSDAIIKAATTYAGTAKKLFVGLTADTDVLNAAVTTDTASDLVALAPEQMALFHAKEVGSALDAGILGVMLPYTPGQATWAYKTVIEASTSKYSATEIAALEAKRCNYYHRVGSDNVTQEGKTPGGEWIDVTRFLNWAVARIQEAVFFALKSAPKIPYTDPGVAKIVGPVLGVMNTGVKNGGFAADPAPTVTAPKVADVPTTDRANRLLPDIKAQGTLAGAIHKTQINVDVKV